MLCSCSNLSKNMEIRGEDRVLKILLHSFCDHKPLPLYVNGILKDHHSKRKLDPFISCNKHLVVAAATAISARSCDCFAGIDNGSCRYTIRQRLLRV